MDALPETKRIIPEMALPEGDAIGFGRITLSEDLEVFRQDLNAEMLSFFRSLPESTHMDVLSFFRQHFQTPILPRFDYFNNYYAPSWSVLYWMERMLEGGDALSPKMRSAAITAHAMALFLHPLDDHLNDGQLPASHLNLLLRSQAWLRMNIALDWMTARVAGGSLIVQNFLDQYYASIGTSTTITTLDGYCSHFRKQMATWMSAPVLMAMAMALGDDFIDDLQAAYGSFGIAWRLMDDLQDLDVDIISGSHSACYFALSTDIRRLWDQSSSTGRQDSAENIKTIIQSRGVWESIVQRMHFELQSAAATMEALQMRGLAEEMRCLARPLVGTDIR